MKKLLAAIFIFSILISFSSFAETKWEKSSFRDITAKAKVLQRKILVEFYATWCSTCIQLENEVLKKSVGDKLSKEFFCLKYDAEQGEGKELAKKFNVISYPTIMILDKDGNEIDRVLDYEDPDSFIKMVFDYSEGKGSINALEDRLKKEPNNIPVLFKVGEKYAFRGEEQKADKYLNKIIELDPKNSKGYSDKALYSLGKYLYSKSLSNYSKALGIFNELDNQFPDSPLAKSTDIERANAYLGMQKNDQAWNSLQNFLLKNQSDKTAESNNAFAWFCYRNSFHTEDAIKVAKDGITINPKADGLYDTMAVLYSTLGEHDKALNSIRKALEIKPKDTYYKTQLEKITKKRDEAKKKI